MAGRGRGIVILWLRTQALRHGVVPARNTQALHWVTVREAQARDIDCTALQCERHIGCTGLQHERHRHRHRHEHGQRQRQGGMCTGTERDADAGIEHTQGWVQFVT